MTMNDESYISDINKQIIFILRLLLLYLDFVGLVSNLTLKIKLNPTFTFILRFLLVFIGSCLFIMMMCIKLRHLNPKQRKA